ncbi:hypothetical protein SBA5_580022 [Candidatus Sulfotelmatomonas gaucii]|uniref:Uncharacterized protein n=1 Tax=Candidatus Sulfuritelmatomonas gaucii TaxID=2043161 RepID=A0A2N9LVG5_9BACT|nr:hypothetical protein SBA5_580022 [Candidatus Sulfotelmatomonas gaucii]
MRNNRTLSLCSDEKKSKADANEDETSKLDQFCIAVTTREAFRCIKDERDGRRAAPTPTLTQHHGQVATHGNSTPHD